MQINSALLFYVKYVLWSLVMLQHTAQKCVHLSLKIE